MGNRRGWIIEPLQRADSRRRWLWIAPSGLGVPLPEAGAQVGHEFYIRELLANGFHVAGVEIGLSLGNSAGVASYQQLYEILMRNYDLNPKARFLAQSNGGLMCYNWAARHPACVDRILGIYPVADLRSWPGLEKACGTISWEWPPPYDMSPTKLAARLGEFNPIEQLAPLVKQEVRILHLRGDQDSPVPLEANSGVLVRRYWEMGGEAELAIIAGLGHGPHPRFYESQTRLSFHTGRRLANEAEHRITHAFLLTISPR